LNVFDGMNKYDNLFLDGSFWYIPGYGNERTIYEYESRADYWNDIYVSKSD